MKLARHCIFSVLFVLAWKSANSAEMCINHNQLVQKITSETRASASGKPEFRIKRAEDGQSLVYWLDGNDNGRFYAATFNAKGCAILTDSGELRRFVFPKTAFNTGVFFEMDVFQPSFRTSR